MIDQAASAIPTLCRSEESDTCGGARVLDLAICLILAVAIIALLTLAL
ncbi:hypothetical protein [Methylobacterium segetis]|nr:hypothetical protein [Methylobacterium segetis]